jgi:hypothetical protein
MGGLGDVTNLKFKAMGTSTTPTGKMKLYAVNGNHTNYWLYNVPVSGTAYMLPGSTTVHWSITGSEVDYGDFWIFAQEGFWDTAITANPVGTVNYRWINSGSWSGFDGLTLQKGDCSNMPVDVGPSSKDAAMGAKK